MSVKSAAPRVGDLLPELFDVTEGLIEGFRNSQFVRSIHNYLDRLFVLRVLSVSLLGAVLANSDALVKRASL
jgi:hypothetical protein